MNTLIDPASRLANVLMEAMLNSLWLGILLTALVGGALFTLRRINAATRHAIWWAALVTVITLPLVNMAWSGQRSELSRARNISTPIISPATPNAIS